MTLVQQRLLTFVVAALVVVATSVALPNYGVVEGVRWIALTIGGGLALALMLGTSRVATPDALDLSILALFVYALISLAWTPDRLQGLHEASRFAPALALFIAARRWPKNVCAWIPGAAVIALVAIFTMDNLQSDWLAGFGNYNKATEAVVVLLALTYSIRTTLMLPVVLATLVWLFFNNSHMELIGFGAIAILFLSRFVRGRPTPVGDAALVIAAALVLATFVLGDEIKTSLTFRLEIAAISIAAWISAPFIGHGFGSFAYVFPFHSAVPITQLQTSTTLIEAAHFEPLQIAVEFGAVGIALTTLVVVVFMRRAQFDPSYASVLAAIAGMSLVSYPLREPATLTLAAIAAARLTPITTQAIQPRYRARLVALTIPLLVVIFAGTMLPGAVLAERQHAFAANIRQSEMPKAEIAKLALVFELDAYRYYPYRNLERIRLFPALVAWLEGGGVAPEKRIEAIWEISSSASPRSPPVVLSRARYLQLTERPLP